MEYGRWAGYSWSQTLAKRGSGPWYACTTVVSQVVCRRYCINIVSYLGNAFMREEDFKTSAWRRGITYLVSAIFDQRAFTETFEYLVASSTNSTRSYQEYL